MDTESLRQKLMKELPPIFTRVVAVKVTGGLIAAGTLANLDSAGQGPPGKVQVGRKVAYEREAFIEWFLMRVHSGRVPAPPEKGGRKR